MINKSNIIVSCFKDIYAFEKVYVLPNKKGDNTFIFLLKNYLLKA